MNVFDKEAARKKVEARRDAQSLWLGILGFREKEYSAGTVLVYPICYTVFEGKFKTKAKGIKGKG